jgi:hypothetical protein
MSIRSLWSVSLTILNIVELHNRRDNSRWYGNRDKYKRDSDSPQINE